MPTYEFLCERCQRRFEMVRPVAERNWPAPCPTCGRMDRVTRILSAATTMINPGRGSKFPCHAYTLSGNPWVENKHQFLEECKKRGATPHGL